MQFHDRELNRWLLPREDQRHSCLSAATGEANDLLGEEHGATGPGDTTLAAARKALELLSIGLIAAGLKRPD